MPMTKVLFEEHALQTLSALVRRQRWFRSKSKNCIAAALADFSSFDSEGSSFVLPVVSFSYDDGSSEAYFVPLRCSGHESGGPGIVFRIKAGDRDLNFSDALHDSTFMRALLSMMEKGETMDFAGGHASGFSLAEPGALLKMGKEQIRVISSEQSNTSVVIGRQAIYKSCRKIEEGINPDYEMPEFLYARTSFRSVPRPLGRIEYTNGGRHAVGILSEYIENDGDCWTYFLGRLTEALRHGDAAGTCFEYIPVLAGITSSMHNALSGATLPAFAPSPVTPADTDRWAAHFRSLLHSTCSTLRRVSGDLNDHGRALAKEFLDREVSLSSLVSPLRSLTDERVCMTRIHGDYHLGQVLKAGSSFYVMDFEGEPMRTIEERREINCPLKDVSGMLRSLDYVISAAALSAGMAVTDARVESWKTGASELFTVKYREGYSPSMPYLPSGRADISAVLQFFLLEKAVYELDYELNNRPDWAVIPLVHLAKLSAASPDPS